MSFQLILALAKLCIVLCFATSAEENKNRDMEYAHFLLFETLHLIQLNSNLAVRYGCKTLLRILLKSLP